MIHLLYLAAIAIAFFALLRGRPNLSGVHHPANPEYDLLLMAGGDQSTVERLIRAEAKRRPGLSRHRCADLAVKRWVADLR